MPKRPPLYPWKELGGHFLQKQKSLAEFAARRRQKIEIIFHRDMCVGKNSSQAASVEFCRLRQNYARSRLQAFWQKNRRFFASFKNRRGVLWRKITS